MTWDDDFATRRILEAQIREVETQQLAADGVTSDVLGSVAKTVAALQREVTRQNTALTVLTRLLVERGGVDGGVLKARYQEAMAANEAKANLVECARCRKQVDKRHTQITALGVYCDACALALSVDD